MTLNRSGVFSLDNRNYNYSVRKIIPHFGWLNKSAVNFLRKKINMSSNIKMALSYYFLIARWKHYGIVERILIVIMKTNENGDVG